MSQEDKGLSRRALEEPGEERKAEDRETNSEQRHTSRWSVAHILALGMVLLGGALFLAGLAWSSAIGARDRSLGAGLAAGLIRLACSGLGGGLAATGVLLGVLGLLVTKKTPWASAVALTDLLLFGAASLLASYVGVLMCHLSLHGGPVFFDPPLSEQILPSLPVMAPIAVPGVFASSIAGSLLRSKAGVYPSVFSHRTRLWGVTAIGALLSGAIGFAVFFVPATVRSDLTLRIEGMVQISESTPGQLKVILVQSLPGEDVVWAETTADADGHFFLEHQHEGVCSDMGLHLHFEPMSGGNCQTLTPPVVHCTQELQEFLPIVRCWGYAD